MFALALSVFACVAAQCENTNTMLASDKIFSDNRETIANLNEPDTNSQTAEEWFWKGIEVFHNADYKNAIEYFKKAIELKPDYADAYFNMGVAYYDWDGQYEKSIECYKKAVVLNHNYADAYCNMGIAYTDWKGQYEKAIECYQKAIVLNPNYADAYCNMGIVYADWKREYEKAIECYKKAIELKPDLPVAFFNMGNSYRKWNRQYEKAIECYEKAIELKPDYVIAYDNMGGVYYIWNKQYKSAIECYEKAIKCYEKKIELNPNLASTYVNMGNAYANWNGQYEKAIECYKNAIECYPQEIAYKPYLADAYCNMGLAYLIGTKQYEQAIEYFKEAIKYYEETEKSNPNLASAYGNIGVAYHSWNGQYEEAIKWYKKVIKLNQNDAQAYLNIGNAYYDWNEQYEKAIEWYQKAIGKNRDYVLAYGNMGVAYAELGEIDAAVENLIKGKAKLLDVIINVKHKGNAFEVCKKLPVNKDTDPFFSKETEGIEDKEPYKDVYIQSLLIMKEVFVEMKDKKDDYENAFAHYTKLDAARKLMEGEKGLWLGISNTMNDPSEGRTLLEWLGIEQKKGALSDDYSAFLASFSFNTDNLNQFRLYGKNKEGKEATGASIVVNKSFFKDTLDQIIYSMSNIENPKEETINTKIEERPQYPLFRCIYIDPKTGFVESIGHKDSYILMNENKDDIDACKDRIKEYEKKIKERKENVQTKLDKLKKAIDKYRNEIEDWDDKVVGRLLLNLRYLVKHVAFKEEQECRIIQVATLQNKDRVKQDKEKGEQDAEKERTYIEYNAMSPSTDRIIFAPMTAEKDMAVFRNWLYYNVKKKIEVEKSELPYSS
jgi:tetratricopeptide (TPR) repeat protein